MLLIIQQIPLTDAANPLIGLPLGLHLGIDG